MITKGDQLANTPSLPQDDKDEVKKQLDDLKLKFDTLENDVNDEDKRWAIFQTRFRWMCY